VRARTANQGGRGSEGDAIVRQQSYTSYPSGQPQVTVLRITIPLKNKLLSLDASVIDLCLRQS
jgi:hypothetical protein